MTIKIGSRTSKLAVKQVEIAMNRIGVPSFEIVGVDTAGDKRSRENKVQFDKKNFVEDIDCLLYTSPSPRDRTRSRMPSSA